MKIYFLLLVLSVSITLSIQAQTPEERIAKLGITLSEPTKPLGNYVHWRRVGNLLYLSGVGTKVIGKVGADLTIEEGYEAARMTGVQVLSILKSAIGDLSKVKQFVRVEGMVNSSPEFYLQPKVINGFSDLMFEVFGEKGLHTRVAVGQVAIPLNMAVEIAVIVELEEGG